MAAADMYINHKIYEHTMLDAVAAGILRKEGNRYTIAG
jgi:hypothetical protein